MGATEEEIKEVLALAMTVGATKTQLLQQRAMDSLAPKPVEVIKPSPGLTALTSLGGPPPSSPFT
ncbi:MAG TPA: hypothetical protein VLR91_10310 [Thermodesulfobacteriota bacterium]|nr:hypothetical protein [Thermodesulfobacteriota bacterium]